ncbi:hypothetical protein AVEN_99687-1 [Araneus ventricosus]|uniref:Uncharacterized protein n=1 Tax=Araneus ventricosus TaxID=182803 RepID=A0A4Y2DP62_ARAVE|nr:hypothetical protein AVEN_99687-1 [Araneus ventricosus]
MARTSKEVGVARRLQYIRSLERCREIFQATRRWNGATGRNSTDHSPQLGTSSDSRFYQATRHVNKALKEHNNAGSSMIYIVALPSYDCIAQ